jgi:AraC-like DNA-binding protein
MWKDHVYRVLETPVIIFSQDLRWHESRTILAHRHDFCQLDYFYRGYGKMTIGPNEFAVRPHDVFICNPGEKHGFQAAVVRPMEGITFKFGLGKRRLKFPNYLGNLSRLAETHRLELESFLRRACVEANASGVDSAQLSAGFFSVFLILLLRRLRESEETLAPSRSADPVQQVMDFIRLHYNHRITLQDLGRIAGLNPKHLCRKFSQEKQLSPIAALGRLRMEAAKKLLSRTELPVMEVGRRVGYADPYHFSKRFKMICGISPRQFRSRGQ